MLGEGEQENNRPENPAAENDAAGNEAAESQLTENRMGAANPAPQNGLEGLEDLEIDADMAALLAQLSENEEGPTAPPEPASPAEKKNASSGSPTARRPQPPSAEERESLPTVSPAQFMPLDQAAPQPAANNIDLILDVALRVTVELGRATMSIREVLELGPGSVVELDRLAGEPVDILVNDHLIARGEVVVVDENFGVRVTEIITPAKRLASLR